MKIPYSLGALLALPALPVLYLQARRVRATVPELPEAREPEGVAKGGPNRAVRLITIGESTVAGVGADLHENALTGSMARELAQKLKADVHWRVYAHSGFTAKKVTHKVLPTIEEAEAEVIVVGLGGNDAFTLNRPWRWKADVQELIETLQQQFPGSPIFFMNMPPIHEFPAFTWLIKRVIGGLVRTLGRELKQVVGTFEGVFYSEEIIRLPVWQERYQLSGPVEDFFSDGVHPAPITYQIWGKDMAGFIISKLLP